MQLALALDATKSGLTTTAERTAIVSKNIARIGDPGATRKIAHVVTQFNGSAAVASVSRAADQALLVNYIRSNSDRAMQASIVGGLDKPDSTVGDPELGLSPAAAIDQLSSRLQDLSAQPQSAATIQAALQSAKDVVGVLNGAARVVQDVRQNADANIMLSVNALRDLLSQFGDVNAAIVKDTRAGAIDITDNLDRRDALMSEISEFVDVSSIVREGNDMALFLDGGITLFETAARQVDFAAAGTLVAGVSGNDLVIDGMVMDAAELGGKLGGLLTVRDTIAPAYSRQLDEMARALIEAFAERDQNAPPTLPDQPGLFTVSGLTAVPASGALIDGLAMSLIVHPNADPAAGGVARVRDGGLSGSAYSYNPAGHTGFNGRALELIEALGDDRGFDTASELSGTSNLSQFAASSAGWLAGLRSEATAALEVRTLVSERSAEILSSTTGVNLDEQMSLLLDLERSYQASSRLIATIDNMYQSILDATRS